MLPVQANPTFVQHKQVALPAEDLGSPHAARDDASYCSDMFHTPDGTDGVHTVHGQEQQTKQQGQ